MSEILEYIIIVMRQMSGKIKLENSFLYIGEKTALFNLLDIEKYYIPVVSE